MGWQYKKKITISGSSGAGEGYQILLKIGESSGAENYDFHLEGHSAKFPSDKDDSGDLRFVSTDEETFLPFWVEKVEGTSPNRTAYVWVKVYDNLDNDVDIWIFYGNSEASNLSNGKDTFEFFDDFSVNTLSNYDLIAVYHHQGGTNRKKSGTYNDTYKRIDINTGNDYETVYSPKNFTIQNFYVQARFLATGAYPNGGEGAVVGRYQDDNNMYVGRKAVEQYSSSGGIGLYCSYTSPEIVKWTSGSCTTITFPASNSYISMNTEFVLALAIYGNNIKFFVDGSEVLSGIDSDLPNTGRIGFGASQWKGWVDEVIVRKYVEPEPSFYSAGTEEDAGNVGFEFTYLYVDKLTVSSGFTTLESAHTLVSSGFYMLMSSFLNSELSIETCQVRNKDKHSVTLVGRIVDSGGNSSVNVYFEYWRKDNPANIISTSVQTITDFTQPAYVFQDIDGLDEVTDYEYKAIIYVDENDKKEGGIVPFTTAGIRQVEIEQNIKFEENNSKIFLSDLYENINVAENSRLWDLLILKEYENLGLLDGDLKFTFMFHYDEKINLQDRYMNLFLSSYEEKAGFYVNRKYREPYPEKWIITFPANFNFSFEKDTDGDGIADGWKYENLVLSDCFIKNYYTKPTVQYIKFGENGKFYSECNLEAKKIMLCLDLAVEGEVTFKVYDKNTGKIFYHKKYADRDFETEIIKFNTDCPLVFEFSGSNSSLYLDNFVVLTDENLKKALTGFSIFRYNIKGTNSDITFVRQYLKDEIMKKEFNLLWNWLPRSMFEIVKNMKGKQIYVRTPLNESFAFYVYGLENNMQNIKPNQEWEQKYQTALLVKEV